MEKIDLHLHSSFSDGTYLPEDLLRLMKEMGYNTLSITDHDSIAAYRHLNNLELDLEVQLISGVEISSIYKGYEFHLLAYFFDLENQDLNDMLYLIDANRKDRAEVIIYNLKKMNVHLELDNIYVHTGENDQIGRMHIARALIERGYCRNISEAFERFIGDNAPAYCKKETFSPEDIINTVKKASGITVLAHPFRIKNDIIIFELIEMGLEGIESYYFKHSEAEVNLYNMIADRFNLLKTGGSDFHHDPYHYNLNSYHSLPFERYSELITRKEELYYVKNKC